MRIFATALSIVCCVLQSSAQYLREVRIVSEDDRSLVLEFTPQLSMEKLHGAEGREYSRFRFYNSTTESDKSSGLLIPFRAVPLLLPSRRYSIEVIAADYHESEGLELAPTPTFKPDKEFGYSLAFERSGREGLLPFVSKNKLAEITDVHELRSVFAGSLKIRPVEPLGNGKVKLYTRVVVRIEFDSWRNTVPKASMFLRGQIPDLRATAPRLQKTSVADSPLAQGEWYKMEIVETGVYKLDQDFFRNSNIPSASFSSINSVRLFGNGGTELSEDLTFPRPGDLKEIPRVVVDNNKNGVFDADDFVLFYGRSTRGWKYDSIRKTFHHYIHPFSEKNYYYLTFGPTSGRAMDTVSSAGPQNFAVATDFLEKVVVEQERFNLLGSGRRWVGQSFDIVDNIGVYTSLLNGLVSTEPIVYRFVFFSRSATVDTFKVLDENDQPIGAPVQMGTVDVSSIDNVGYYAYESPVAVFAKNGGVPGDRSVLKIRFGTRNQAAKGWLDWFEILYRRRFEAVGDALLFSSPDTTATVEYTVKNLSSRNVYAFDVTDHQNAQRVTQIDSNTANSTWCTFRLPQVAGSIRDLLVVGPGGFKTPANVKKVANQNLHGIAQLVDFIIISPPEFLNDALRLKAHREKRDSLKTVVADVDQVFNEFSGGLVDPMAIRDFLKYAQSNWAAPQQYVLLFGTGHYDYKNITTSVRNWIPPYESVESNIQISSYASDDHFAFLTPGSQIVSLAVGRLPVRSAQEATAVIDKIIQYETTAPLDPWRNRITYVGDDGLTSTGDDFSTHTAQAENLAELYTPPSFEKKKIYIVEYPTVNSATGRRKPLANKDIIDAINAGTIVINYTGHGNTRLWAHEAIFTREESLPQLVNKDRQTFLVAATCNFAQYDNPNEQSAGEQILTMDQGGAIAEVTANRAVYSFDNAELNYTLYVYLFQRPQGRPQRIGDAMFLMKQVRNSTNDLKFHLLGDPTLRLAVPRTYSTVDSVNGVSTAQLTTLKSLGRATITGVVKRPDSSAWSTFSGKGLLEFFDAKRQVSVPEWGGYTFDVTGSLLYRGEVSIGGGRFRATIPIPKDVTFGNRSRISLYASSDSSDAVGFTENVAISGTDTTAAIDTTGPRISAFLDDVSFRSGDVVQPNPTLIVQLFDESGINTSTVGIGHRLEASISNPDKTIDLSQSYRGNLDTYQSGEVRYPLANLPEGKHSLRVKAWDVQNNSSSVESYFEVRSAEDLSLVNVFNFPNPFSQSTVFTFQRNSFEAIDVDIKVYTVAGRLIATLSAPGITDRFVQVPWNGRDNDDNELANGVYFYKVIARTQDRRSASEAIGKLAIVR